MTKNKAHDASTFPFQKGQRFLLDANIWIYLFPPAAKPTPNFAKPYSGVLKRLVAAKTELVIEALVLSEYMNRYWRVELSAWQRSNPGLVNQFADRNGNFDDKKFRLSPYFKPIGNAAVSEAKQILKLCGRRDTPLELTRIDDILAEFEAGNIDFNDGVLADTCRLRGWKMITHDRDMTVGGIDVITTNPNLLAACP